MKDHPFFSVVTPLYNKEKYIAETIESVLAQTYSDFELIIVNDSSTDRSLEVVNSYDDPRIKIYTKTNGGVSAARNFGISKAKGEIVCFLDADDIWSESYLKTLFEAVSIHPEIGLFCTSYTSFRDTPSNIQKTYGCKKIPYGEFQTIDFFKMSYLEGRCIALTSAVAIKNAVLKEMDYVFPIGYNLGEDIDTWFRVATKTKVLYINRPLMLYRQFSEGGLTKNYNYKIFPYWTWFEINDSKWARKFTSLTLYAKAKMCYNHNDYSGAIKCLNAAKGSTRFIKRQILKILIIIKK